MAQSQLANRDVVTEQVFCSDSSQQVEDVRSDSIAARLVARERRSIDDEDGHAGRGM
jgi:hypothetical protein